MCYIKTLARVGLLVGIALFLGSVGDCENGGDVMLYAGRMLLFLAMAVVSFFVLGIIDYKERIE